MIFEVLVQIIEWIADFFPPEYRVLFFVIVVGLAIIEIKYQFSSRLILGKLKGVNSDLSHIDGLITHAISPDLKQILEQQKDVLIIKSNYGIDMPFEAIPIFKNEILKLPEVKLEDIKRAAPFFVFKKGRFEIRLGFVEKALNLVFWGATLVAWVCSLVAFSISAAIMVLLVVNPALIHSPNHILILITFVGMFGCMTFFTIYFSMLFESLNAAWSIQSLLRNSRKQPGIILNSVTYIRTVLARTVRSIFNPVLFFWWAFPRVLKKMIKSKTALTDKLERDSITSNESL